MIEELNLKGITTIYGAAGTGKTTFCLCSAIQECNKGNKVIFLDTENGFSVERFKQLTNNNLKLLDNIFLFHIDCFKNQQKKIKELKDIISRTNISLIIIDTIGYYYRRLLKRKTTLPV